MLMVTGNCSGILKVEYFGFPGLSDYDVINVDHDSHSLFGTGMKWRKEDGD